MTKKRLTERFIVKKPIEGVTKAPFSATSRHLEKADGGYARFEVIAMNLIDEIEKEQIAAFEAEKSIPDFQPGDTVKVNVKVIEGSRERCRPLRACALRVRAVG